MTGLVRRALAVALLAAAIFAGPVARHTSPGPAACPSGQQWETLHGAWKCTAIPPDGFVPAIFSYTAPPCPPATLKPGTRAGKPDCKGGAQ